MKRNDHLALAVHLVHICPEVWRARALREALYAGSVLPDSNPATYLRGVLQAARPAGHDLPYSYPHLLRLLTGLLRTGVQSRRQAYRLGALTHYLADALTYPHMPSYRGNMLAHNRYEQELHGVLAEVLRQADRNLPVPALPVLFLADALKESRFSAHTPRRDAERIVATSTAIWRSILQENSLK